MANTVVTIIFQHSHATPLIRLSLRVIKSLVTTYQIYMKFCIVTNWRMAYTKMALIFQIYDVTPVIRLLIRVLIPLIFSCLVSGAYLFCDLVYCLVGSTRRTSF